MEWAGKQISGVFVTLVDEPDACPSISEPVFDCCQSFQSHSQPVLEFCFRGDLRFRFDFMNTCAAEVFFEASKHLHLRMHQLLLALADRGDYRHGHHRNDSHSEDWSDVAERDEDTIAHSF